jgi:hypothetical protein
MRCSSFNASAALACCFRHTRQCSQFGSGLEPRSTGRSNPSKSLGVYTRATPASRGAARRYGVGHETGRIFPNVPNPLPVAGMPGRNAGVGYVRYGPAAAQWCAATAVHAVAHDAPIRPRADAFELPRR